MDPTSIKGTILLGIFSGLMTTLLLVTAGFLFRKAILPWYEMIVFKGVDLRGVWAQEREIDNAHHSITFQIDQHAHIIRGTATYKKSGSKNGDYVQFFEITGYTWEGFLVLTMRSTDRKSLSFVASLLKVKERGNSLEGHWVFRAAKTDEAESESLRLIRQKA